MMRVNDWNAQALTAQLMKASEIPLTVTIKDNDFFLTVNNHFYFRMVTDHGYGILIQTCARGCRTLKNSADGYRACKLCYSIATYNPSGALTFSASENKPAVKPDGFYEFDVHQQIRDLMNGYASNLVKRQQILWRHGLRSMLETSAYEPFEAILLEETLITLVPGILYSLFGAPTDEAFDTEKLRLLDVSVA